MLAMLVQLLSKCTQKYVITHLNDIIIFAWDKSVAEKLYINTSAIILLSSLFTVSF